MLQAPEKTLAFFCPQQLYVTAASQIALSSQSDGQGASNGLLMFHTLLMMPGSRFPRRDLNPKGRSKNTWGLQSEFRPCVEMWPEADCTIYKSHPLWKVWWSSSHLAKSAKLHRCTSHMSSHQPGKCSSHPASETVTSTWEVRNRFWKQTDPESSVQKPDAT